MLALTDEALARFVRAARQIPHAKRGKWLERIARQVDPPYPRQKRYYDRRRDGMVCINLQVDPTWMAEFLHACGVRVLYQDRATLAAGIEELLRRWERGELSISAKVDA
jgi:hypothetical protein